MRARDRLNTLAVSLYVRWAGRGRLRPTRAAHVLLYHAVGPVVDLTNDYSLRVERHAFASQLAWLRECCSVLPLADIVTGLDESRDFAPWTVAITFDDGYRDNLEVALPLLQEAGLPACVFVSTDLVAGTQRAVLPALRPRDVRALADAGVEIGSHLCAHRALAEFTLATARDQLRRSREVLEDMTGHPVRFVSYPFGGVRDTPRPHRRLAAQCGYAAGFSALYGGISRRTDRFWVPRVPVVHTDTLERVRLKAAGSFDGARRFQVLREVMFRSRAQDNQAREEALARTARRTSERV